jgi:hypothetical protein
VAKDTYAKDALRSIIAAAMYSRQAKQMGDAGGSHIAAPSRIG